MKKFTELPRPVLVGSLRHKRLDDVIEDIKESEEQGAHAFIFHTQLLDADQRDPKKLERVFRATDLPIMALNYRTDDSHTDDERSEYLLSCVKAGAAAVDMWFDMFDYDSRSSLRLTDKPFATADPAQVTMLPEAIEKQKEFIGKVHALGAEVLVSSHVWVQLDVEQGVSLAEEIASRGADIVKIIQRCGDYRHMLTVLETIVRLHQTLDKRILYQCCGPFGAFVRVVAPMFGSDYVLCHAKYGENSNREKPLIKDVKAALDGIKWRI